MSGAGKNIAKKVVKGIDWDHLAKVVVTDEGRRELGSLRRAFDDVSSTLETKFSTKEVNIDWSFYRQKLGPKIVDTFKNSYEALKIPAYEDKFTPEYQKKFDELLAKATEQEEESKRELVRLTSEIENIRKEKENLRNRTVDEYFAEHPEVKEEIDAEIRNHKWD